MANSEARTSVPDPVHTASITSAVREEWTWRSPELGRAGYLDLCAGPVGFFERGKGRPLVFVHGWMANANLWRKVTHLLSSEFRCITLDLPLGAHRRPATRSADLSPEGCGGLIAEALEALDLRDLVLVGNDSGGAYSQIAVARRPDRVGGLVLNCCETPFDQFPPHPFDFLPEAATEVENLGMLFTALRDPATRSLPQAFGLLIKRHGDLDERVWSSYTLACLNDPDVLGDASAVMSSARSAPVQEAGHHLIETFRRPVLFLWSAENEVFPVESARRYAQALHDGCVELIDDTLCFTAEDRPIETASAIARFAGS